MYKSIKYLHNYFIRLLECDESKMNYGRIKRVLGTICGAQIKLYEVNKVLERLQLPFFIRITYFGFVVTVGQNPQR